MTEHSLVLPRPPVSSLHPLHLLDEFLESFEETTCAAGSMEDRTRPPEPNGDSADVAGSTTTSVVAATDNKSLEERRDHVLRAADYLYGGSILEAALAVLDAEGAIRRVCSKPSQRRAFLVRGTSQRHSGGSVPTDYFCLVALSEEGFDYCLCRSYFEQAKNDPKGLCKHLLALKLMPVLECPCREETIPDVEFSTFMLRCMLPRDLD
jgi:predicted nucleic acid-binding Zn finger protein